MKYKIIDTAEGNLLSFIVEEGPNEGTTFNIHEFKQEIQATDSEFEIEYTCASWPRGILPPEKKECEEIVNFVMLDLLTKALNHSKQEINEPIQTTEEK